MGLGLLTHKEAGQVVAASKGRIDDRVGHRQCAGRHSTDLTNALGYHQVEHQAATGVDAEDTQTLRSAQDDNRGKRLIEEEATGAVTGGIVGGVLGAAVALLIPVIGPAFAGGILVMVFSAALGAVTGGMLGALVTLGVPEEQARHYEEEFKAGRTIVTVKTEDQQQKVLDIMYRNGVRYANAHDRS